MNNTTPLPAHQHASELLYALEIMLQMPEYDGTPETSRTRQRCKNIAKRAIRMAYGLQPMRVRPRSLTTTGA